MVSSALWILPMVTMVTAIQSSTNRRPYPAAISPRQDPCPLDSTAFELVTGYVFSSPADLLDSHRGTVMLQDCLDLCRHNVTCRGANFETGLCVLFGSDAEKQPGSLSASQFPVFTVYAQKICVRDAKPCDRPWAFERVPGYKLVGFARKRRRVPSRQVCLQMCLVEKDFICRSANYESEAGECELSDMDRHTVAGSRAFRAGNHTDYLESNCVDDPVRLCDFHKLDGRILKTVDSVFQDVATLEDCRELCLRAPFRCHSFDYNATEGNLVCRLSHHSTASLTHLTEPHLPVKNAATYELGACYNVSIDCRAGDMVARIRTSRLFNGKVYAKGSPNSCVEDVAGELEFQLRMPYADVECGVRRENIGRYANDIIIQHHDQIVTSGDLGLAVSCQYDLSNKSVANDIDLSVGGDVKNALSHEAIVDSPNVAMKIVDTLRQDIRTAQVGDPLVLRFEIMDRNSPYEIFVRELVAMDGVDSSEILLVDADGCPTDHRILGPLAQPESEGKTLEAHFDAFKFPTSEIVQFRALVTPCLPSCPPVTCDLIEPSGLLMRAESSGRRRRRQLFEYSPIGGNSSSQTEEMLVVQTIHIQDKFGFQQKQKDGRSDSSEDGTSDDVSSLPNRGRCTSLVVLVATGAAFLAAQVAIMAGWAFLWQRRRIHKKALDIVSCSGTSSKTSTLTRPGSTASLQHTRYPNGFMQKQHF